MIVRPIAQLLGELRSRVPAECSMRPGLNRVDALRLLRENGFPHTPPSEWFEAYEWQEGANGEDPDEPLFHYHRFVPIVDALEIWKGWVETNRDIPDLYDEKLLPMFAFSGECYAIECAGIEQKTGCMRFVHHDDILAFDSLGTMLESIDECYRSGAYDWEHDCVDERKVMAIKLAWNSCRRGTNLEMADHP